MNPLENPPSELPSNQEPAEPEPGPRPEPEPDPQPMPEPEPEPGPESTPQPNPSVWDMSDADKYLPTTDTSGFEKINLSKLTPEDAPVWSIHPPGKVYSLDLDNNKNYLITADAPLQYTIMINGGNIVWLRGIQIMGSQLKNKTASDVDWQGGKVRRERIPTSGMIYSYTRGPTIFEGCYFDLQGINADVQIMGHTQPTAELGREKVKHIWINSLLVGGSQSNAIHSDVVHWQGTRASAHFNQIVFINSAIKTGTQGLTTTVQPVMTGGNYVKEFVAIRSQFLFASE